MRELGGGRIGIGSMALGIGLAAMDYATSYAKERVQFDKPIIHNQAIQWMIADNYTHLEAARLLLLQAAYKKEHGMPFMKEASMANFLPLRRQIKPVMMPCRYSGAMATPKNILLSVCTVMCASLLSTKGQARYNASSLQSTI